MHLYTLTFRDSQTPISQVNQTWKNNICTNRDEIKQRLISRYLSTNCEYASQNARGHLEAV